MLLVGSFILTPPAPGFDSPCEMALCWVQHLRHIPASNVMLGGLVDSVLFSFYFSCRCIESRVYRRCLVLTACSEAEGSWRFSTFRELPAGVYIEKDELEYKGKIKSGSVMKGLFGTARPKVKEEPETDDAKPDHPADQTMDEQAAALMASAFYRTRTAYTVCLWLAGLLARRCFKIELSAACFVCTGVLSLSHFGVCNSRNRLSKQDLERLSTLESLSRGSRDSFSRVTCPCSHLSPRS